MNYLYKLPRKVYLFFFICCAFLITILTWNLMKPKYLCTNGMGPIRVEGWLEKGYKIIGKYKLRNPRPRLLTEKDWQFIQQHLPGWIHKNYPKYKESDKISKLSIDFLKSHTVYQFTLLHDGEILEEDVYLLSLGAPYETDQLKIYIPKASVYDKEQLDKDGKLVSKNILVYPFLTENWESNINEAKPYEAEDFW